MVTQLFSTVPLILKGEVCERGAIEAAAKLGTAAALEHADHEHGIAAWEPKDRL